MAGFWSIVGQILENALVKESTTPMRAVPQRTVEPELCVRRTPERRERIRSEIFLVAPHFSRHEGIDYDEENCDWLMIPKYPLPEKWRARWCKLLVVFPEMYPIAPPIGFYLNRKFSLKDGGKDSHLIGFGHNNAPDLQAQGWQWYCCYLRDGAGGWRPSARYDQPDNLRTFLSTVREVLTND